MIYELAKAVGSRLKAASVPCSVEYLDERFGQGVIEKTRIVVSEDGDDQWGPPMTTRGGVDPARWNCWIAVSVGIEAVATKAGAMKHDHRRLARRLARAFMCAIRDELSQSRWNGMVLAHQASGGFVRSNDPREVGARYALDLKVGQAVAYERNFEDVDAADLVFAPTVIVNGEYSLGGP